jgi:hypothetical protein
VGAIIAIPRIGLASQHVAEPAALAAAAGAGAGSAGPQKAADRRANEVFTRTLRQFLQRLSPPGLQLGCKDPTRLELI